MDPQDPGTREILERLAAIEARLSRLEGAPVLASPLLPPLPLPSSAPPVARRVLAEEPIALRVERVEHVEAVGEPTISNVTPPETGAASDHASLDGDVAVARASIDPGPSVESEAAAELETEPVAVLTLTRARTIENLIGGRYFLAIGTIVVVIGVGFFLKLGYDSGWFRMSPAWKCIWGAIFGFTMLGAGELARRRINVLASSGLSAAGIGALYLSSYAAHGFYAIVGPVSAFVFLCIVTVIGIGVAVAARQAGVAVLAVLGGYLAPFLLRMHTGPLVLPLHAVALMATGLILSGWRPEIFRVLRTIAWWGTVILGTLWVAMQGVAHPVYALFLLGTVWCAFHAELILSVRGERETDDDAPAVVLRWRAVRPIATSLTTTAWSVFLGVVVLRNSPLALPDWFPPAGAMVGAIVLAVLLAGHLRVLRDSPRTDAQRLGAGLALQAGALLITVLALAFTGSLEVVAWLAVGVAAVATGTWLLAPSLGVYGLVILAIGATRLVVFDSWYTRAGFIPIFLGPLALDRWSLLMTAAAAAWISSALLLLRLRSATPADLEKRAPRIAGFLGVMPDICTALGLSVLLASLWHPDTSLGAMSAAWTLIGACAGVAGARERRLRLPVYTLIILAVAGVAWANAYVSPGWSASVAGWPIHPGFFVGEFIVVVLTCLGVFHWRNRRRTITTGPGPATDPDAARSLCIVSAIGAVALEWCVSSLEVFRLAGHVEHGVRAQVGGLSLWWGVFAAVILGVGFRIRAEGVRLAGLVLVVSAIVAWGVAFISPGWNAASGGSLVHPGMVVATLLVGAVSAIAYINRGALKTGASMERTHLMACVWIAAAFTWGATSLDVYRLARWIEESDRARLGALSLWWGLFAAGLLHYGLLRRIEIIRGAGFVVLAGSLGVWVYTFIGGGWTATAEGGIVHPGFVIAAVIVGALAVLARLHRAFLASEDEQTHVILCIAVAVIVGWGATSLDIFRLAASFEGGRQGQHAAVSVWWGLVAVSMIFSGFRWRAPAARYAGLALLGTATLKALLIDLADVSPAWRVVSVLGLGLLMMGVAIAYVRISARLAPAATLDTGDQSDP